MLTPAIHIAFLGVFPDVPLVPDLRESFTAARALAELNAAAQVARMDSGFFERWQTGRATTDDAVTYEIFMESQEEQERIRLAAEVRMRNAYEQAAQADWLRPVRGVVLRTAPVFRADYDSPAEAFETAAMGAFRDYMNGDRTPVFSIVLRSDREQVAGLAYIRCILQGHEMDVATFRPGLQHILISTTAPYIEPKLNPAGLDMRHIDTVRYCRSDPALARSECMGFPPPGGPAPRP